jgi:nucleotide-binding universal stress UspA family protein
MAAGRVRQVKGAGYLGPFCSPHGLVEGLKREIEAAGVPARAEVRRRLASRVAQAILDAADEHEANMVVMGSRGVSDLRGLLLGSVTHKVLQLSDRAVLVAR